MTTNVVDLKAGIVSSDSRWSFEYPKFILFADDVGFDKIKVKNKFALVFAGNSFLIQLWKDWIDSDCSGEMPPYEHSGMSMAVSVTDTTNGTIPFERGQNIQLPEARFAGSGSIFARNCWAVNGCAQLAVTTASFFDCYSGGIVKYHWFSGDTNVGGSARYSDINRVTAERGFVMYKQQPPLIVPAREAVNTDRAVKQACDEIAQGSAIACAPCDAMYEPWTADEKRLFSRVIAKVVTPR